MSIQPLGFPAGQESVPLPAHQAEQSPEYAPMNVEAGQVNPEIHRESDMHSAHAAAPPPVNPASIAVPTQAGTASFATPQPQVAPAYAAVATDDEDLIANEWVIRAKSIISRTRDNPHAQKQELSKIKAEYIEKRYDKKIKLADDVAGT